MHFFFSFVGCNAEETVVTNDCRLYQSGNMAALLPNRFLIQDNIVRDNHQQHVWGLPKNVAEEKRKRPDLWHHARATFRAIC